jgi:hypothetical protein
MYIIIAESSYPTSPPLKEIECIDKLCGMVPHQTLRTKQLLAATQ